MAMGHRIVRVPHSREGSTARTDHWKHKRAILVLGKMQSRDFNAIALKTDLIVRLGYRLHSRNGNGSGKTGSRDQERQNGGERFEHSRILREDAGGGNTGIGREIICRA